MVPGRSLPAALSVGADYGLTVMTEASPAAYRLAMFILSDEGQRILAARGNVPTNRTIAELPPGLALVDVGKYLDQEDKWMALLKQTFAGQGR